MMALARKPEVKVSVRITKGLYESIMSDLKRPHSHAAERVGFTFSRLTTIAPNEYLILLNKYEPVDDDNYVRDRSVGAHINSDAILKIMQRVLDDRCGAFHTHLHWGTSVPQFSSTDLGSLPKVVKSFRVGSVEAHGLFLMNDDSLNCLVWLPGFEKPIYTDKISVVGYPSSFIYPKMKRASKMPTQLKRQSFLGKNSHWSLNLAKVGIVGLGGGGSHIAQQLAYLGIGNYVLCDPDKVEHTNLNRMVGSTVSDANSKKAKVLVAKRVIKGVLPSANVQLLKDRWENCTNALRSCDVIIGCLDTVAGRSDLEAECRRYFIPLIDIGMDVYEDKENFDIRGQVILSMPGDLCFRCFEFITEENLKKEAEKYGAAGGRPQVVWCNGVLASNAVGILADIITGWSKQRDKRFYLSYNGNSNSLKPHTREQFPLSPHCAHYPIGEAGPVRWKKL